MGNVFRLITTLLFVTSVTPSVIAEPTSRSVPVSVEIYYVPDSILTRNPISESWMLKNFWAKYVINTSWQGTFRETESLGRYKSMTRDIRLLVVLNYGDRVVKYYSDLTNSDDELRNWCRNLLKDRPL